MPGLASSMKAHACFVRMGSAVPYFPPTAPVVAQATPSSAAQAPDAADAAVAARAKDWLHRLQTDTIDRTQLAEQMNAATDAQFAQVGTKLAPLGDPISFTLMQKATKGQYTVYLYEVKFAAITLYETFTLDSAGKIAGLFINQQPPQ